LNYNSSVNPTPNLVSPHGHKSTNSMNRGRGSVPMAEGIPSGAGLFTSRKNTIQVENSGDPLSMTN